MVAATTLVMAATSLPTAHAHGGEEGLVVEPVSTWPGGTVVIRADVATTSPVTLVLRSTSGEQLALASVQDPGQGHFERAAAVPLATSPGPWSIVALSGRRAIGEANLTITGPPSAGEQDDRAEPVRAAAAMRPTTVTGRVATARASEAPPWPVVGWIPWAVASGAAAGTLVRIRGRRIADRAT